MANLFALLFIAALVGIFRPYINGLNRKHFGLAAFVSFIMVGVTAPNGGKDKPAAPQQAAAKPEVVASDSVASPAAAPHEDSSKWAYDERKDEMRGTVSQTASVTSENKVTFDFPYGESGAQLWLRRDPKSGVDAAFQVDKGQVLCNSFTNTKIAVKFDDGPVQSFRCTGTSDGSSETAFIVDQVTFIARLKKSKKVIIEAEFFQEGNRQFTFLTSGLKWD